MKPVFIFTQLLLALFSAATFSQQFTVNPQAGRLLPPTLEGTWYLYAGLNNPYPNMELRITFDNNWAHVKILNACVPEGCLPSMVIITHVKSKYVVITKALIDYERSKYLLTPLQPLLVRRLYTEIFIMKSKEGLFLTWSTLNKDGTVFRKVFKTRSLK